MKLGKKLFFIYLFFAVIIVSVGVFESNQIKKQLKDNLGNNILFLIKSISNNINKAIYNRIEFLQSYTKTSFLIDEINKSNTFYSNLKQPKKEIINKNIDWILSEGKKQNYQYKKLIKKRLSKELIRISNFINQKYGHPVLSRLTISNKFGAVIALSEIEKDFKQDDEIWWKKAKKEGIYIEDYHFDRRANVYALSIALKITDENNKFIGILKAVINIKDTINLIQELTKKQKYNLSYTLVKNDGTVIFSSYDGYKNIKKIPQNILFKIKSFLNSHKNKLKFFNTNKRNGEIIVFTQLNGYKDFNGLNWILIAHTNTNEIFKPIQKQQNLIIIATIIIIIFAFTSEFIINKLISPPIQKLKSACNEISQGKLPVNIDIKTKDEFGELAKSFSEMSIKLKNYQEKILSFSSYIENIMKSISDLLIVTSTDLTIQTINKAVITTLHYDSKELIGKPLTNLFSDKNLLKDETRRNKFLSGKCKNIESRLITKEGKELIFLCSTSILKNEKTNKITGIILILRDITEKKMSEKKQKELENQIQHMQKLDSISILAGGIAHDFNNILTAIIANISLLKMNTQEGTNNYEIIKDAEKAARIAKNLTQQLLSFSKRSISTKKRIQVKELIEDTVSFTLRGSEIIVNINIPNDLWAIEVDENQISQVIHNIIINAKQAMKNKGVIDITAENTEIKESNILQKGKYIKIYIKDNGPGIRKEFLDKIFDPYFTTKKTGSGLGLSISYYIIKNHNGHIEVESTLGQGTTFTIYLPATTLKEDKKNRFNKDSDKKDFKGTILVMDDDEFVLKTFNRMFNFIGIKTLLAKNGKEALEIFRNYYNENKKIDAIILDLTVPGGMGAKDTIKQIHSIDPTAKIILSTGYAMDTITVNYKQYGFFSVIIKPFDIDNLIKLLKEIFSS